jgi:hypothetical protein
VVQLLQVVDMCFSAGASFGAGIVLATAGSFSLKQVKNSSQVMFGAIPFLFALQQACEGMLWLSLTNSKFSEWQVPMTYLFLFFAQGLWVFWVPVSVYLFEGPGKRKKILFIFSVVGCFSAFFLICRLIFFDVSSGASRHHIFYNIQSGEAVIVISSIFYFLSTVVPLFVSRTRNMVLLGIALLGSLIASWFFYETYFISVWCFFAALLSSIIIFILRSVNRSAATR